MLKFTPVLLDIPSPEQVYIRGIEDALPLIVVIAAIAIVAILLIRRAMKKRK